MTNVLIKKGRAEVLETIVLDESIDVYAIPRRPYDYNKGDRRFFNRLGALAHADEEARRTGVRQVVRIDSADVPGADTKTLYLVQAVGS